MAKSFDRILQKILREQRKVMVLAAEGRVMATTDIPKNSGLWESRLVGIYDASLPTFSSESLFKDLVFAESQMI